MCNVVAGNANESADIARMSYRFPFQVDSGPCIPNTRVCQSTFARVEKSRSRYRHTCGKLVEDVIAMDQSLTALVVEIVHGYFLALLLR